MCQESEDTKMEQFKTYTFRLYPNNDQKKKLNSFLGTTRFVYNHYLELKEKDYSLNFKDMKKDIPSLVENYPWIKEVDSMIPRCAIDNLENAYNRYFNNLGGKPKFKKHSSLCSYRTSCIRRDYKDKEYQNIRVDLVNRTIKLPKISEIKIRGYRNLTTFDKKIINVTVKRVAGKYYANVLVSEDIEVPSFKPSLNMVGIDLGVKTLMTTSDGEKIENIKEQLARYEHKLKGLNRWLARSKKGSKNREKIIIKIQKVNQKIRNAKKFYNNIMINKILKENDVVFLEDLKTKEMIENGQHGLAKSISNSNFSDIINKFKYKAMILGKKVYQVSTYFPSSQICYSCGSRNERVKNLSVRKWKCFKCHSVNERDINASLNILEEGMKLYFKDLDKEMKLYLENVDRELKLI